MKNVYFGVLGGISLGLLVLASCDDRRDSSDASEVEVKQLVDYARTARSNAGRLGNAEQLLKRSPDELKAVLPELEEAVNEKNFPEVTKVLKQVLQKAKGG